MKYGAKGESKHTYAAAIKAAAKARAFFESFSIDEMALALLICMVDLGRRVNEKEQKEKSTQ